MSAKLLIGLGTMLFVVGVGGIARFAFSLTTNESAGIGTVSLGLLAAFLASALAGAVIATTGCYKLYHERRRGRRIDGDIS